MLYKECVFLNQTDLEDSSKNFQFSIKEQNISTNNDDNEDEITRMNRLFNFKENLEIVIKYKDLFKLNYQNYVKKMNKKLKINIELKNNKKQNIDPALNQVEQIKNNENIHQDLNQIEQINQNNNNNNDKILKSCFNKEKLKPNQSQISQEKKKSLTCEEYTQKNYSSSMYAFYTNDNNTISVDTLERVYRTYVYHLEQKESKLNQTIEKLSILKDLFNKIQNQINLVLNKKKYEKIILKDQIIKEQNKQFKLQEIKEINYFFKIMQNGFCFQINSINEIKITKLKIYKNYTLQEIELVQKNMTEDNLDTKTIYSKKTITKNLITSKFTKIIDKIILYENIILDKQDKEHLTQANNNQEILNKLSLDFFKQSKFIKKNNKEKYKNQYKNIRASEILTCSIISKTILTNLLISKSEDFFKTIIEPSQDKGNNLISNIAIKINNLFGDKSKILNLNEIFLNPEISFDIKYFLFKMIHCGGKEGILQKSKPIINQSDPEFYNSLQNSHAFISDMKLFLKNAQKECNYAKVNKIIDTLIIATRQEKSPNIIFPYIYGIGDYEGMTKSCWRFYSEIINYLKLNYWTKLINEEKTNPKQVQTKVTFNPYVTKIYFFYHKKIAKYFKQLKNYKERRIYNHLDIRNVKFHQNELFFLNNICKQDYDMQYIKVKTILYKKFLKKNNKIPIYLINNLIDKNTNKLITKEQTNNPANVFILKEKCQINFEHKGSNIFDINNTDKCYNTPTYEIRFKDFGDTCAYFK